MKTMHSIAAVLSLVLATGAGKIHNNESNPARVKTAVTANHESLAAEEQPGYFNAFCTVPARPGPIAGSSIVCLRLPGTYSISPVPGATSYVWTVIGGGIVAPGTGTKVQVRWGPAAKSISVRAINSCGSSPSSPAITITRVLDCTIP
ncbi:MAG TPA: hypothetical protein PKM63_18415 [Panacibacter sp.]|nr:hypothetical protein [Panacibacter sp.]HNP46275.1 hypothetical protein [Panacibacter sp.]